MSVQVTASNAAQQLEALLLRGLLEQSGLAKAFAHVPAQAGMFLDTLANAVAQQGGVGLASQLQQGMAGHDARDLTARLLDPAAQVTSGYGVRQDPLGEGTQMHHGVDLGAPLGSPVHAALAGVVSRVGEDEGLGHHVVLSHANGMETLYAHLERATVTQGQRVAAGTVVGNVGSSGRSTGPHLHFEVKSRGNTVDPGRALKAYSHVSIDVVPPAERRTP